MATLSSGCVAYWKLDESSGNAIDSSGNGQTLTNTNVTYSTGKIGNGGNFNLASSSHLAGTGASLPTSGAFSMSIWYKGTTPVGDGAFGWGAINASGQQRQFLVNVSGGTAYFGGFGQDVDSGLGIVDGNWHDVVFTFDGTTLRSYVDTVAGATGTPTLNSTGSTAVAIGSRPDNTQYLTCQIDEVGVWNRALTTTEIKYLWANGGGRQYPFAQNGVVSFMN